MLAQRRVLHWVFHWVVTKVSWMVATKVVRMVNTKVEHWVALRVVCWEYRSVALLGSTLVAQKENSSVV